MQPIRFRPIQAVVITSLIAVMAFVAPTRAADDKDGWEKLGSTTFSGKTETNEIEVTLEKGIFKAIKLSVEGADANIEEIEIKLSKGKEIKRKIKDAVKKGDETRPIVLELDSNVGIKKISIKAKSEDSGKKTVVTAWGKKT